MIYFDTDVLVHYILNQDKKKHLLAKKLYEKATLNGTFFVSFLTLQETGFVLAKLKMNNFEIDEKIKNFYNFNPINYTFEEFKRATTLCQKVGFQNINDCIHTAIAENYCKELYTFNQADFKQIKNHTSLKINILTS